MPIAPSMYSIYQNHPLNSLIDVAVHYVTIASDGSDIKGANSEDDCNATLYSVLDITNYKRWYVCELHMLDQKIHGTLTVFDRNNAFILPTREALLEEISNFISRASKDKIILNL